MKTKKKGKMVTFHNLRDSVTGKKIRAFAPDEALPGMIAAGEAGRQAAQRLKTHRST